MIWRVGNVGVSLLLHLALVALGGWLWRYTASSSGGSPGTEVLWTAPGNAVPTIPFHGLSASPKSAIPAQVNPMTQAPSPMPSSDASASASLPAVAGGASTGAGSGDGELGKESVLAQIKERIAAAKRYPPLARRRGIEGEVVVRFSIDAAGAPQTIEIIRSSGSPILDEEVRATVLRAAPMPVYAAPISVPVVFDIQ